MEKDNVDNTVDKLLAINASVIIGTYQYGYEGCEISDVGS